MIRPWSFVAIQGVVHVDGEPMFSVDEPVNTVNHLFWGAYARNPWNIAITGETRIDAGQVGQCTQDLPALVRVDENISNSFFGDVVFVNGFRARPLRGIVGDSDNFYGWLVLGYDADTHRVLIGAVDEPIDCSLQPVSA